MNKTRTIVTAGLAAVLLIAVSLPAAKAAPNPAAPAPGAQAENLAKIAGLSISTAHEKALDFAKANKLDVDGRLLLSGADARLQLVVTAEYAAGSKPVLRDVSRDVTYAAEPAGIVNISKAGLVTPVQNGKVMITTKAADGSSSSREVIVENFDATPDVHFANKVVPIFTKLGCNGGGCHGKSGGQNGFRLSLLGFEPQEDYEWLVKESRGRRLFPAAPDQSLFLQKAINHVPHGGGERLKKDSHDYRMIRRWIAQGMPASDPKAATVDRIEVFPYHRIMPKHGKQQLSVIAIYTDGSTEDVTNTAQYEANNKDMAEADATGLVEVTDMTGDVGVMIRYQAKVAVFRATIPLGAPVDNMPKPNNFIDELVFKKLEMLGMPPSEVCDDRTFIRRVSLDVVGRLPLPERVEQFVADKDPNKRSKYIDELLSSTAYADFFANKWSSILRNKRRQPTFTRGTFGFHLWLRQSLHENKPYDEMVRGVLAASGDITSNPAVSWHREVTKPEEQLEDVAQLFLGIRLQCAKCHHHPFEKWAERDYYGFSAFFTRVKRDNTGMKDEIRVYHDRGDASASNPKTGERLKPMGLGSPQMALSADDDPRHALVDWMAAPNNPFFAKSLTNRYWKHFFNRGLVDPEDDMRATNPATNPELLDQLAYHFVNSNFDLKQLIKTICESKTYQLSAMPNEYNANDKQNFSRYYPRRLNAEVLLDAIDDFCDTTSSFTGLPQGTRAIQIPDRGGVQSYFLTVFGAPEGSSVCECERTSDANLAQCLHLLNSKEIQQKLSGGRAVRLARAKDGSHDDRIRELYHLAFAREPDAEELKIALGVIEKYGEKNVTWAYEDIAWAIINTKEFLFNH